MNVSLSNEIKNEIHSPNEQRSRKCAWTKSIKERLNETIIKKKAGKNGWNLLTRIMCMLCLVSAGHGPAHYGSWVSIQTSSLRVGEPQTATKHSHAEHRTSTSERGATKGLTSSGQRRRRQLHNLGHCMCIQLRNNGMAPGEQLSYQAREFN